MMTFCCTRGGPDRSGGRRTGGTLNRWCAHLRCTSFAGDVFEVDDFGHAIASLESIPLELEEATLTAVANCPERAISVSDQ
jgi:ferredoxin